jgi:hypothetical protein
MSSKQVSGGRSRHRFMPEFKAAGWSRDPIGALPRHRECLVRLRFALTHAR